MTPRIYSKCLPKCISWIKPLNRQSVVWIFFCISHDTLRQCDLSLFLVFRLKSIIYYYDHYWLEYLSYGPISGYGIIKWTFSFLFLTYFIRIQMPWQTDFSDFKQSNAEFLIFIAARRDSYNLFIRYFTILVQCYLFAEHIRYM